MTGREENHVLMGIFAVMVLAMWAVKQWLYERATRAKSAQVQTDE